MARGRHGFAEHTGDVEVSLHADTIEALFVEAGCALAEVEAGRAVTGLTEELGESLQTTATTAITADEPVHLLAADRDALLVEWLNELIFRTETTGKIYSVFRIEILRGRELTGAIGGQLCSELHTPVKAATFHRLKIKEESDGFSATVVLDV